MKSKWLKLLKAPILSQQDRAGECGYFGGRTTCLDIHAHWLYLTNTLANAREEHISENTPTSYKEVGAYNVL